MKPQIRKALIITVSIFVVSGLLYGLVIYQQVKTFRGIQDHTGYELGQITDTWEQEYKGNKTYYSKYSYSVNDSTYIGRQTGIRTVGQQCLIVYDRQHPQFSMIANYPDTIETGTSGISIDASKVTYEWEDYIPGSRIFFISDN